MNNWGKMDTWEKRLQLLLLLSIFFVYLVIQGVIENDPVKISFWGIFTVLYILSLTIAILVRHYTKKSLV